MIYLWEVAVVGSSLDIVVWGITAKQSLAAGRVADSIKNVTPFLSRKKPPKDATTDPTSTIYLGIWPLKWLLEILCVIIMASGEPSVPLVPVYAKTSVECT